MPFEFKSLNMKGLVLVKPTLYGDKRGFFMETYKESEFTKNGINTKFVQDNHSKSSKGVLRGLHYQARPYSQAKLIRCTKGKVYDVVVDLRKDSETFGKWERIELSEENQNILFIPKGFAHGFYVLSEEAELAYKTDSEFKQEHDRGLKWDDKDLNIDWGIEATPILSEKDKKQTSFSEINKEELI
jgi:dTDP-4-dehydrorhamnose 3,5-epimerase